MIPFETDNHRDPDRILRRAKQIVVDHYNGHLSGGPFDGIHEDQVYVVWFSKTLQNWKALLSTDVSDGRYYELTHNGAKGETYVDVYVKESNTVVADD